MTSAYPKFPNAVYRSLDQRIAERGWGDYPARKWHEFWILLDKKIKKGEHDLRMENPLILGGDSASLFAKRRRFLSHLLVAETIGESEWMFNYLDQLAADEWAGLGAPQPVFRCQNHKILYITGRGGSLDNGYANVLKDRCLDYDGIEVNGTFLSLSYEEQVSVVTEVLDEYSQGVVIANSYGAYLVISALVHTGMTLKHCFLHSPITGSAMLSGTYFKPAGARVVEAAISECSFSGSVSNLVVVVGENDVQCDPERCQLLAAAFEGRALVLPNQGHQISPSKLERLTDQFLDTCI